MNSELPVSADALLAERARLEEELQASEDWCELLRLKSRKDRGEGMSAVNAARLEMVLIDALSEDPNFVRYKAVCVALERLIRGLPPLPPARSKPEVERDDLTQIRGITASMARRLNALDVTTFAQIADWRAADIQSISADLGIGKQIYAQNWIEQAALLANPQASKPAASAAAPSEPVSKPDRSTPPPATEQFVQPVSVREAQPEKVPVHLSRVAAVQAILREVMPETAAEKPAEPVVMEAAKPPAPTQAPVAKQTSAPIASQQVATQAAPADRRQPEPPIQSKSPKLPVSNAAPAAPAVAAPPSKKDEPVRVATQPAPTPLAPDPAQAPARVQAQREEPKPESVSAAPARPLPAPPVPLRPDKYGKAPEQPVAAVKPSAAVMPDSAVKTPASAAASSQPARPLPMPPTPLRVQALPRVADVPSGVLAKDDLKLDAKTDATKPQVATSEPPLRAPPRPLVVTRASLPPRPPQQPAKKTDVATSSGPSPVLSSPVPVSKTSAPSSLMPPVAASTLQPPASPAPAGAPAAPAMSIAEAIAYAAEVARQGPRPSQTAKPAPGRDATVAAQPATPAAAKVESPIATKPAMPSKLAAPSAPQAMAKDIAKAPSVPPPLPAGFVPPEPAPLEPVSRHVRSTTVHAPRFIDRDDPAGYRLSAEEATVEIVVISPSEPPPPPRVALANVSAEATAAAPRAATPIGRFLKALTGN